MNQKYSHSSPTVFGCQLLLQPFSTADYHSHISTDAGRPQQYCTYQVKIGCNSVSLVCRCTAATGINSIVRTVLKWQPNTYKKQLFTTWSKVERYSTYCTIVKYGFCTPFKATQTLKIVFAERVSKIAFFLLFRRSKIFKKINGFIKHISNIYFFTKMLQNTLNDSSNVTNCTS